MRGQDHWKLKDAQKDCDTRAFRPKLQRSELKKIVLAPVSCAGKKLAEEQELSSRQ